MDRNQRSVGGNNSFATHVGRSALAVTFVGASIRLLLTLTTFGSDDVHIFRVAAKEIARVGPDRIYQSQFFFPYDLPPLDGWILDALQWLGRHGISFPATLRAISVAADVGASLLVFKIVERSFGPRRGLIAACLVALNPVSILVSGFHGNVDSVAFFFALLAFYLAVEKGGPGWAGITFGVSLGIKIVPVVALPVLAFQLIREGTFKRFAISFAATTALIWLPPAIESRRVFTQVLGYSGGQGHVRPALAVLMAVVAGLAIYARRGPYVGAAASIIGLLALSPAWAPQYLVWPVAFGAVAIQELPATAYAIVGGAFLFETYTHWSGGFPWRRAMGRRGLDLGGKSLLVATFITLALWLLSLARSAMRRSEGTSQPLNSATHNSD